MSTAATELTYQFLADAVLALHVALVVFVVGGLAAVLFGNLRGWRWVNHMGFRVAHMAAIVVVVAESWFGMVCPLTTLEMWLRVQGGAARYSGGFIEHWLGRLLYYEAPPWIFIVVYSLFGLAVAATWWFFPPAKHRGRSRQRGKAGS